MRRISVRRDMLRGETAARVTALGAFVAACASPRPAQGPTPPRPPSPATEADHLVLHYAFDDCSARDSSGHGHDGAIHGAPDCVDGPLGKALSFDGAHDYLTVAPIPHDPMAAALTVAGWVKAVGFGNAFPRWVTILTIGNTAMDTPFAVIYAVDDRGQFLPHTRATSVTGQLEMRLLEEPAGAEGVWLFFAWTYDRGMIRIYRDGALATVLNIGLSQLASTSRPIDVGRDVPGATEYLKGALDDLRLYDYALSAEEIRKLWQLGSSRSTKP
jgi:hypothetical protein